MKNFLMMSKIWSRSQIVVERGEVMDVGAIKIRKVVAFIYSSRVVLSHQEG